VARANGGSAAPACLWQAAVAGSAIARGCHVAVLLLYLSLVDVIYKRSVNALLPLCSPTTCQARRNKFIATTAAQRNSSRL